MQKFWDPHMEARYENVPEKYKVEGHKYNALKLESSEGNHEENKDAE